MQSIRVAFVVLSVCGAGWAASGSLENELNSLAVPSNQIPPMVASEKMYAVQNRYAPLTYRSEVTLGGSKNFTPDGMMISQQLDLAYRFYLSDRWFVGTSGSYVFNSLSNAGQRLMQQEHLLPDIAYAKYRADLLGGFNIFYGKFRFNMDKAYYFDQYVALGPGVVMLDTGTAPAAVADVGFSFWFGRTASVRLGLKDYFFQERRRLSKGMVHNLLGHLDVGVLFGGGA